MKALITGIGGFAGQHLARRLVAEGVSVFGATRCAEALQNHLPETHLYSWNICDADSITKVIREVRPDTVFHLAAVTSESQIIEAPELAYRVNVLGTERLLHAVLKYSPQATVLLAGSSAEYGNIPAEENPIRETASLRPVMQYGVSKVAQSLTGQRYWLTHRLRVIRTRAFNYSGPGQSDRFVIPSFCRQLAELERVSDRRVLTVGNLDGHRDFTDVRDVVRAYATLATHGESGEVYNIASGRAHRIGDLLDKLLAMTTKDITIDSSSQTRTGADVPVQRGDASKIEEKIGWKPEISIEATLKDTVNYWRARIDSHCGTT